MRKYQHTFCRHMQLSDGVCCKCGDILDPGRFCYEDEDYKKNRPECADCHDMEFMGTDACPYEGHFDIALANGEHDYF